MAELANTDRRTVISGLAVGVTGIVLPTRAAAASGDPGSSGLGGQDEETTTTSSSTTSTTTTTTTTTTVPAPTAAYEPQVDFTNFANINGPGVNVYMGWGAAYSYFTAGAVGKVSGVTSADKSDFDFTITYTTASPELLQTATGASSNGYASRTLGGLKSGSLVTVTITSKTTAGSTNPAGVERTFTHTR